MKHILHLAGQGLGAGIRVPVTVLNLGAVYPKLVDIESSLF
jgi:hypothetical protein